MPDGDILKILRLARLDESVRIILLTQNQFAIVDADDYEKLSKYKWFYKVGGAGGAGYAARTVFCGRKDNGKRINKTVRMHREIMAVPDDMEVDHDNRDTLNNCRYNLKNTTKLDNLANKTRTYQKHTRKYRNDKTAA